MVVAVCSVCIKKVVDRDWKNHTRAMFMYLTLNNKPRPCYFDNLLIASMLDRDEDGVPTSVSANVC